MRFTLYLGLLGLYAVMAALVFRSMLRFRSRERAQVPSSKLAALFLIYGALGIGCSALFTPPFQVSDEIAHFFRADQVSLGHAIGHRQESRSGGVVDQGISQAADIFGAIILHPDVKATSEMFARAADVSWHSGKEFSSFENTSIYPPVFYALSAFGVVLGKTLNLDVIDTMYLSRLLDGVAAVAIGAAAIVLAGPAAPWFFAVLTLPMTLSQMGSVSQDALMFPSAALAAAVFVRLSRTETDDVGDLVLLVALLALMSLGRVTQAALALLPFALRAYPLPYRIAGAAVVLAAAVVWSWLASRFALVQFGLSGADSAGQVRFLASHPLHILVIATNTLRLQADLYLESFVGELGWLDLRLPPLYHALAWVALALAFLTSISVSQPKSAWLIASVVSAALVASVAGLFAALYVSWTPVGNFIVDGVQGCYFIPLAFFAAVPFATGSRSLPHPISRCGETVVMLFPLITIPVMINGLIERYYMSQLLRRPATRILGVAAAEYAASVAKIRADSCGQLKCLCIYKSHGCRHQKKREPLR